MKKGYFISIEGNDGAGKTTALAAIRKELQADGWNVICSREPGGTGIGEQIRNILLDTRNTEMDPKTEAILYAASRRQHLIEKILPAIEEGAVVLCDRFLDSSLAYQGAGRQLGMQEIYDLNSFGVEDHLPDLTLFFSVSEKTGAARIAQRGDENRLDLEGMAFQRRVRQGFEELITQNPDRIVRIDAEQSPEQVIEQALAEIRKRIGKSEIQVEEAENILPSV